MKKRTPRGRNVKRYVKQKPDQAVCGRCGRKLAGIPRVSPSVLKKMARGKRTVSRKFGGVLCASCVKDAEKYKARMEGGFAVKRDLTLEKFLPAGWCASLSDKVRQLTKAQSEAVRADVEIMAEGIEGEPTAGEPKAAPRQAEAPAKEKPKKVPKKKKAEE